MLGRLRDGSGLAEARHQLDGLSAELRSILPHYEDYGWDLRGEALHEALVAPARPMLTLLLGSAAFVLAYSVSRRRREMGIRMALGSARADIVALVVRHGGRWIAVGLGAGLGGAVLLSRYLESLLFEVGADPRTLLAVSLVVASIGLIACLVPALRASRVDPAKVLRAE